MSLLFGDHSDGTEVGIVMGHHKVAGHSGGDVEEDLVCHVPFGVVCV